MRPVLRRLCGLDNVRRRTIARRRLSSVRCRISERGRTPVAHEQVFGLIQVLDQHMRDEIDADPGEDRRQQVERDRQLGQEEPVVDNGNRLGRLFRQRLQQDDVRRRQGDHHRRQEQHAVTRNGPGLEEEDRNPDRKNERTEDQDKELDFQQGAAIQ